MRLVEIVDSIRRLLACTSYQDNQRDVHWALRRVIGRTFYERLIYENNDRREIYQDAARLFRTTEDRILQRISETMKMSYLRELPIFDPKLLPEGYSLERYILAGVSLMVKEGKLYGVSCLEPRRVRRLLPELSHVPLYLTTYETLKKNWKESLELTNEQSDSYINENEILAEKKSLLYIFKHAAKYGAEEIALDLNNSSYSIQTLGGRIASGKFQIANLERFRKLLTLLEQASQDKETSSWVTKFLLTLRSTIGIAELVVYAKEKGDNILYIAAAEERVLVSAPILEESDITNTSTPVRKEFYSNSKTPEEYDVFFVDDNATFRKICTDFLVSQGLTVKSFEKAECVLKALGGGEVSGKILVTDLHMPDKTGEQLVHAIKNNSSTAELPTIILSSDEDPETVLRLFGAPEGLSPDVVIKKSEDPRILCSHIKRLIQSRMIKIAA